MTVENFAPGQRWLSNNEPELGLGLVISVVKGRVTLLYPAKGETRQYTNTAAPLTRFRLSEGEHVTDIEGKKFRIASVDEKDGVITYFGTKGEILTESSLADSHNFTKPYDRLINAHLDDKSMFNLRSKALHHRFETLRGHQRGFLGGRIELIPHQIFAALQIRRKGMPRLVLADESGVGKSIESVMVLHRLLVTERIERALIVVPERSIERWRYELTRRFNLNAIILTERKKAQLEDENHLVLTTVDCLPVAAQKSWDLLIVDEADTVDSKALKKLCDATPGLILMTDLPPEIETKAHLRLRKLVDGGEGDMRADEKVIALAEKLLSPSVEPWEPDDIAALATLTTLEVEPSVLTSEQAEGRERLLAALLEAVGAGRRLIRNKRDTVEGLPEREVFAVPLSWSAEVLNEEKQAEARALLNTEFLSDGQANPDYEILADDLRIEWLKKYLGDNPKDKIVLIVATQAKAERIASLIGSKAALHHEGMTLEEKDVSVQRFMEKDEAAAFVLVCSEIGVEARSLGFAHHVVLFDLPTDPLLIQRRIGSLDRFGHMAKVRVHVPYVTQTVAHVVFRWLNEGLSLFDRPLAIVHCVREKFLADVQSLMVGSYSEMTEGLEKLLPKVQGFISEMKAKVEKNRDRLTELASYRVLPAHKQLDNIRRLDSDLSLDFLMLRLYEHFGFDYEDVGERTYRIRPREKDRHPEAFLEINPEGQTVTYERQKALARDDIMFLTWDHPLVMRHLDLVIDTHLGNSGYVVWEDLRSQILLLEALFRIELANPPKRLYITRYFSPAGFRAIINHELQDVSADYPMELINKNVRNGRREWIRTNNAALQRLLPRMIDDLRMRAQARADELSRTAVKEMEAQLKPELARLQKLKAAGGPVTDREISLITQEIETLTNILTKPKVVLDALRLVRRGPTGKGI